MPPSLAFRIVWSLLLTLPLATKAATLDENALFRTFSACDNNLFPEILRQADALDAIASIERTDDQTARIAVTDRRNAPQNQTRFKQPIDVNGIQLTGFFDETNSDPDERYLYWGFFSPSTPAEIASKLVPLITDHDRLLPVENTFTRLELYIDGQWRAVRSPSDFQGRARKIIERVLILEKSDVTDFPGSRISCSLQGPIPAKLLHELRPDISESSIKMLDAEAQTAPPEEVLRQSLDLVRDKPYFRPRFKTLNYSYAIRPAQAFRTVSEGRQVRYEALPNGLLKKTEPYTTTFTMNRLMVGGLIQLISQEQGKTSTHPTMQLEVTAPDEAAPGRKLLASQHFRKGTPRTLECVFEDREPGTKYHSEIPGNVIKMACQEGPDSSGDYILVEDLGIFLLVHKQSKNDGEFFYDLQKISYTK